MTELRVWQTSLDGAEQHTLRALEAWLHPAEGHRCRAFLQENDRSRFILGRALVRAMVALDSGLSPRCVEIEIDPHGRPLLDPALGRAFSLSHSGDVVMCAFGTATPLGVDVERVSALGEWRSIERLIFTSSERARLRALPQHEARCLACSLWTLKEAYSKAQGQGLVLDLARVGFELDERGARLHRSAGTIPPREVWNCHRLPTAIGHRAAMVWLGDAIPQTRWISAPEILTVGSDVRVQQVAP